VDLELKLGVKMSNPTAASGRKFVFEISQRDAAGKLVSQIFKTLSPGLSIEDRQWQPVHVPLQGLPEGGGTLEFRFQCEDKDVSDVGAFAAALIVKHRP